MHSINDEDHHSESLYNDDENEQQESQKQSKKPNIIITLGNQSNAKLNCPWNDKQMDILMTYFNRVRVVKKNLTQSTIFHEVVALLNADKHFEVYAPLKSENSK